MQEIQVQSLGREDPLEKEINPLQFIQLPFKLWRNVQEGMTTEIFIVKFHKLHLHTQFKFNLLAINRKI